MSEQEALERIPSTITMGQLAVAQNANTISPGLLNRLDREMNTDWWTQQEQSQNGEQQMPSEPGLEAPFIDPIDILVAGATGGGSLAARGGGSLIGRVASDLSARGKNMLLEAGKEVALDRLSEWYKSRRKE